MKRPNTIQVYYRLTMKDKDGNVVKQGRLRKSRSFTKQFIQMFECLCSNSENVMKDIGGVDRTGGFIESSLFATTSGVMGALNVSNKGIVVGTDDTTPTNTDYELTALIPAGSSSDQLIYGVQSAIPPAVISGNVDYKLIRVFINNSGGTITVKEIGVHISNYDNNKWFLFLHDTVTPQDVLDGQTLTVEYIMRTTV